MTHALTRVLKRTKRKRSPEYLPPYFWHRYSVWRFGVSPFSIGLLTNVLALLWPHYNLGWGLLLALIIAHYLHNVPHRIRQRWARRWAYTLYQKLAAHHERCGLDPWEDTAKLTGLMLDVDRYINHSWSSLSIRRTPWEGSGTKFTVYERRRQKREFVFYHD